MMEFICVRCHRVIPPSKMPALSPYRKPHCRECKEKTRIEQDKRKRQWER